MAETQKQTPTAKNNDKPKAAELPFELPKGYQSQSTDVVGFWIGDKEGPKKRAIHCVPLFVNLSDSGADERKPSALLFVQLVDPCKVAPAEDDGKMKEREEVDAKPGDIVGIWFSAGMADIAMCAGRKTFMFYDKDVDVGRPSKMKHYQVNADKSVAPKRIPVREDRRVESAGVKATPFAGIKKQAAPVDAGDAAGGDDIPF